MPLEATCKDCSHPYSYPALQKHVQTGRCPACQHKHDVMAMNNEIASLQARIDKIMPTLKKLQENKISTQKAALEAYDAWENAARVHAALDHKLATITHERDLMTQAKELETQKSQRKTQTAEQKAKAAIKKLSPEVRAALLKQFAQEGEE